jgi:hypothetical protein
MLNNVFVDLNSTLISMKVRLCLFNPFVMCLFRMRLYLEDTFFFTNSYQIHSNSFITNSSKPAIFVRVRYNRVNLCTEISNLTRKVVRNSQMFVNNRVRCSYVSLLLTLKILKIEYARYYTRAVFPKVCSADH